MVLQLPLKSKNIVLATGSAPITFPGFEPDGKQIITSDHAINLQKVPKHMIIIGAGVIGLELGSVWSRLGAEISIIELMPRFLVLQINKWRHTLREFMKDRD
jgi:dihydrolipoamide dehydrogenase